MITVLLLIITLLLSIFFESFLFAAFGLKIFLLLCFLSLDRFDIKLLSIGIVLFALVSDVIFHYPFGTNLLLVGIPLLVLYLSSLFISMEESLFSYIVKFFCFLLYFVLLFVLPNFLIDGSFGILTWSIFGGACVRAFVLTGLLLLLSWILGKTRKEDRNMRISKKWN